MVFPANIPAYVPLQAKRSHLLPPTILLILMISCSGDPKTERTFYDNGNLEGEIIYFDRRDTTSFLAKGYYRSGQLKYSAEFRKGQREGKYVCYFENGRLKDEMHFSEGLLDGIARFYNPRGELREESFYRGGQMILDKEYWENPVYHLQQIRFYVPLNDSVKNDIGRITCDSSGKVIERASFFYDVRGPDTIPVGQNGEYTVRFLNKRDDFLLELYLGDLTPEAELRDTWFHALTPGDTITFSLIAELPGEHLATGLLFLKGDTTLKFPFYMEYFVRK